MREISDNVEEKYITSWEEQEGGVFEHRTAEETCTAIINAYLTECRVVFDRNDESTWPKTQYAPSGIPWLVIEYEGVQPRFYTTLWDTVGQRWMVLPLKVTHYLDPADIMPEGM